jgi:hypothetical protein
MGAQELYDAYRAADLSPEDLDYGRYIRIRQIQRLQTAGQLDSTLRWSHHEAPHEALTPSLA